MLSCKDMHIPILDCFGAMLTELCFSENNSSGVNKHGLNTLCW